MRNQHPDFGERIRARRRELGLSQQQLAGDVVTSSYVSLLESGKRAPTLDVIIHLAERLMMPVEELVGQNIAGSLGTEPAPGHGGRAPAPAASTHGGAKAASRPAPQSVPQPSTPAPPYAGPAPEAARTPDHHIQILAVNALQSNDYARSIELLRGLYDQVLPEGDPTKSIEVGLQLQRVLQTQGDHPQRLALLEELATTASEQPSEAVQVAVLTELGSALRDTGHLARARTPLESALTLLRPAHLHGTSEHVRLLGTLISVLCELSDMDSVPTLVSEMLELAESVDAPGILGRSQWVAAMAYDQLGRAEDAHTFVVRAREHLPPSTMTLRDWLRFCRSTTSVLLNTGHLDDAHEWLLGAEQTTSLMNIPAETAALTALRARHESARGRHESALELYVGLTGDDSPLSGLQLARVCLAKAEELRALDRTEEAVEALRGAAAICEESGAYQLAVQMWRRMDEIRPR
ncbi:helix-turn-helix domain-containing protein [Streptomyces sp. NPDC101490]|uniref:helix-turn-helix domain-containing protein n=1 Tax=Streptomyces sp. NPDC101490 TaxID=3366143 RepID=UPI003823663E